jgi:hypothetical protein
MLWAEEEFTKFPKEEKMVCCTDVKNKMQMEEKRSKLLKTFQPLQIKQPT